MGGSKATPSPPTVMVYNINPYISTGWSCEAAEAMKIPRPW